MSPKTKPAASVGDRLPYLLSKLKTPRVLERLEQTAATAREEGWPYEQFLEVLLEAEVFARDASGARNRIRHVGCARGPAPSGAPRYLNGSRDDDRPSRQNQVVDNT